MALSPAALLEQSIYQEKLHELKQLVSVTPHYYEALYLKPLLAMAAIVQQLPYPFQHHYEIKNGFLLAALDCALAALKFRRGYMLPLGADTETCYREQDAWTYAIFTAALLQECWLLLGAFQIAIKEPQTQTARLWNPLITSHINAKHYYRFRVTPTITSWQSANPLLVKLLLPENAFAWLCSYPYLFNCWWKSIAGILEATNPIQDILQKAHHHLLPANGKEPINIKENNKKEACVSAQIEIEEQEKSKKLAQEIEAISTISIAPTQLQPGVVHETIIANKNFSLTEILITTLKQQFKQKQLTINQPQDFIHRVHEGILLITPAIWDWLFAHCPELKNKWLVPKHENLHNTLLQALLEENQLIKNSTQNSLLHRYFIGRWEARQVLAGVVVPIEDLFPDGHLPTINEQLHLEPAL